MSKYGYIGKDGPTQAVNDNTGLLSLEVSVGPPLDRQGVSEGHGQPQSVQGSVLRALLDADGWRSIAWLNYVAHEVVASSGLSSRS